jgi:hypothetical protein
VSATTPNELDHAERHMAMARDEWRAGKLEFAAMHLREGLTDAAWSLFMLTASLLSTDLRSHEPPRNSGEGNAVNGSMPLAGGDESHTAGA